MLKFFRHKNVAKIVLWGLLILILPAFVLWGTGNLGRSSDKGPSFVGTIDNRKVTFEDFAGSLAGVRCHIVLNYFNRPEAMDTILKDKPFIGRLAWDRTIMLRQAGRRGIRASDSDVVGYLRSHPLFLRNGKFDEMIYAYVLKNNIGLDARAFEEIVRENIAINKFGRAVTKDTAISDGEALEGYTDEAKSKYKDKDEYIKDALEKKRELALEDWLRAAEKSATLNINPEEYDKYYR